jgi:aspartate/methionine/tyrosine aminotransferase
MSGRPNQSLQQFFDSPAALACDLNLSASAAEPLSMAELVEIAPEASRALDDAVFDYPKRHGALDLRGRVAARYDGISDAGVILTSGLDDALSTLFHGLLGAGDRVVVLTPCYPPQLQGPAMVGAEVARWKAREENGFVPDLDELRGLLATPTRMVLVTFPQNPTGFTPDPAYVEELIAIVEASGALLISDEVYSGLPVGGDAGAFGLAARSERIVTLHGLSKTVGLPGLRFGWIATRDDALVETLRERRKIFNCYLPTAAEHLARVAFDHEPALLARCDAIRRTALNAANDFFRRHENLFTYAAPEAGVLCFPRWNGPGGARALSDRLLAEAKLVLAPSTCFDAGDANVRVSVGRRTTPAALERLGDFLERRL